MRTRRVVPLLLLVSACSSSDPFPPLPDPTYPTPAEVQARFDGLSFDGFLEVSFAALVERSPETLTDLGLSAQAGRRDNLLDDGSDSFLTGTYELAEVSLTALRRFDRSALGPDQRVSYDVWEWYLDDLVRERPFVHHVYPLGATLTSEEQRLQTLLLQVHPLATPANAEDYVERLWRVRRRVDQVIAGLQARTREGLVPPRAVLAPALRSLGGLAAQQPDATALYTRLSEGLAGIEGLPDSRRDELLAEGLRAIRISVLPAWRALADSTREVLESAPDGDGVWALPQGEAFYAHCLRHHTNTELSADEIHALGLAEVERLQRLVRERFAALGVPAEATLQEGFATIARQSGQVPASECLARYRTIIQDAQAHLAGVIDVQPRAAVEVRADPVGGYYVAGPPDGSLPGVFYAGIPSQGLPAYSMKTLAYHEAVPGHHLQVGLARERTGPPALRRALQFTAHVEGWALYAEQLAAEVGFYEGDPHGDLGRLQYELFRAARLVVDTGLHARRWSIQEATTYLQRTLGFSAEVLSSSGQVYRYLSWPGQATSYKVGMLRILAAREGVQARLGARYSPTAFHRVVLEAGSLPLPALERLLVESFQR